MNGQSRSKGPPNRMNDLVYRDWMKFQKSFFRFQSDQSLVFECIQFFTKSEWPSGEPSRTLVLGFPEFSATSVSKPRKLVHVPSLKSAREVLRELKNAKSQYTNYDFAIIDLRHHVHTLKSLTEFQDEIAESFFSTLRNLLASERYCCVVVDSPSSRSDTFPIPWSIAQLSRKWLKLRDEKIGLVEKAKSLSYCLFFQAAEDARKDEPLTKANFRTAKPPCPIPLWIIPKPPPRKKNEILHPAKFPETLIEEFLQTFTKAGNSVLDPMVGTGSTVIAALRKGRNAVGVDLMPEFVEIARNRIKSEQQTSLSLFDSNKMADATVVQGDSSKLDQIPEVSQRLFDYAITSPPYWSMLANPGSENQRARREKDLRLVYSDDQRDLGNVADYDAFISLLRKIYIQVALRLQPDGVLTVIVKNVKRNHTLYPLAWDIARSLCSNDGFFDYIGCTFWCQDDVGLKPFAVGIHWVSNTLHQYCLHFRRRAKSSH